MKDHTKPEKKARKEWVTLGQLYKPWGLVTVLEALEQGLKLYTPDGKQEIQRGEINRMIKGSLLLINNAYPSRALWITQIGPTYGRYMIKESEAEKYAKEHSLPFAFNDNATNTQTLPTNSLSVGETPGKGAEIQTAAAHSEDYTSVGWQGRDFTFKKGQQAAAIRHLWEAWENGTPTLSEMTIGDLIGSSANRFRLDHLFSKHPAWNTFIVRVAKGTYKLDLPPKKNNPSS